MVRCDSPDHHHLHCQELVDCSFTKVIACRVGASFVQAAKTRDFGHAKREKPPRDVSATADHSYIPRLPLGKLREFTLQELKKATDDFSIERKIGQGGFGKVFRGILSDGASVAVKVRGNDSGQGLEQFQAEIRVSCTIMSRSHPNLVPAIGYHSSRKSKKAKTMIVYPFMANGDVSGYFGDCQPSRTPLDWPTRKRIALGVARGISSLHELGIVHRDVKPSNVLLDENFDAHVGDFGLSRSTDLPRNSYDVAWFRGDEDSHHCDTTMLHGTMGYMAPEYSIYGSYSRKSDVFAFGVTLIQLVTGKPAIFMSEDCMLQSILSRAEQLFKNEEDLTRHMHPGMLGMYVESEAIELIRLGLVCTQEDPNKRPLMPEVIAIMEGSSTTLKQKWDNYNPWSNQMLSTVTTQTEAESNKEPRVGDILHRHQGHQSGGSCYDSMPSGDASSGISGSVSLAGLTGSANSRFLENDTFTEIVEVNPNERGNSKQLSSQANRYEGQSDEDATQLREVLDQMRAMELNHQAVMEEMHQKQIAAMRSMIKMQEQYIQKVNEMQAKIGQLKEASQKL